MIRCTDCEENPAVCKVVLRFAEEEHTGYLCSECSEALERILYPRRKTPSIVWLLLGMAAGAAILSMALFFLG